MIDSVLTGLCRDISVASAPCRPRPVFSSMRPGDEARDTVAREPFVYQYYYLGELATCMLYETLHACALMYLYNDTSHSQRCRLSRHCHVHSSYRCDMSTILLFPLSRENLGIFDRMCKCTNSLMEIV